MNIPCDRYEECKTSMHPIDPTEPIRWPRGSLRSVCQDCGNYNPTVIKEELVEKPITPLAYQKLQAHLLYLEKKVNEHIDKSKPKVKPQTTSRKGIEI